ncbi:MAG: replication initiation protein [Inoviridae sp.]|nr:MAG: replication initiation protein [Inoviridae sp.]
MLDMLVIRLPVKPKFIVKHGDLFSVLGDVADYGLASATRFIKRDPVTKEVTHGELYHPYESLPSSYSSMAIKFYDTCRLCPPYMELKASPAKLLQGHNVYGGESIYNGAAEMFAILESVYPWFFSECLDIEKADVRQIDTTFHARLPSQNLVLPALRFLSSVSNGQRKNDTQKRDFINTVYYGGATSRLVRSKIYAKHNEVKNTVEKLQKKSDRGCVASFDALKVYTPELIEYSKGLLRFEHSVMARKLERSGLPTNLWRLIEYQNSNPDLLQQLWLDGFKPILKALEGEVMEHADDKEIQNLCMKKLVTITPTGKQSYTKANNAFNFYQLLKMNGWLDVKSRYSVAQFNKNVKALVDIGVPKALLQNLGKERGKVILMVDLLKIDFFNQAPEGYKPPNTKHYPDYDHYFSKSVKRKKLRLVA